MPKIQIVQQETMVNNSAPSPRAQGERFTSVFGDSANTFSRGLDELTKTLKIQEENDAIAWSGNTISNAHLQWSEQLLKMQESAQPGASGFTPQFLGDYDKYAQETVRVAPSASAKKYTADRLNALRTQLGSQALTFEAGARRDYRINQSNNTINNNAKTVQDAPENFNTIYAENRATIESLEIPPKEKLSLLEAAKEKLSYAAVFGMVQRDPRGTAMILRGTVKPPDNNTSTKKGDFSNTAEFIFKHEGGYSSNDGNGPVNFGINEHANPDIDVKKLTKEGAKAIYKQRYWDAINGDQLPDGVALMTMDTAVNMGVPFAKKILTASGGDIEKMAQMRREKYASLVQDNPRRYGKYAKQWETRLTDAQEKASAMGGSGIGTLDVSTIQPDQIKANGNLSIDMLSFENRIRLLQLSDTLSNQKMAQARESLRDKMQDFNAMATSGVNIPSGSIPTAAELVSAYGQDGLKMYSDDVKPMLALNGQLQRFSTQSVADRQATILSNIPKAGEGFYDASKRFEVMQHADILLQREMKEDPSAYAIKYSTGVNEAFQKIQKIPAQNIQEKSIAAQQYVKNTLAEQNRLGVANPAILPKTIADNIVKQFYDQPNGGQNSAVLIEQQANLWGKYWPQVYGQMASKLPGAALVIGSGIKPQAAELLARAAPLKPEELKAGLLPEDLKDVKSNLQEAMSDFQRSLNEMSGGAQTFSTFNDQAERLAIMYVRQGQKPSKAAESAFQDILGSKYEFVPDSNNKNAIFRVPKQYPAGTVQDSADLLLEHIDKADLAVPPSLSGLDKKQARNSYVSVLKDQAYWVTAPDESGLVLYIKGAAVTDNKGRPITKKWDQLQLSNPFAFSEGTIGGVR